MDYSLKSKGNNTTRVVAMGFVVLITGVVSWGLATGMAKKLVNKLTNTEVAIIEQKEDKPDEPPPPPPPVDINLPPPPPQVIMPDFTFDTPPPANAIRQVEAVREPAPPPKAAPAPPPPKPAVTIAKNPSAGRVFEKPEYPPASLRAGEQGDVTVSVCVDERGRLSNPQIVKSSGFPRLDEATLKGLPRTRMEPAKGSDGKPIAYCDPPYVFTLQWKVEDARR